MGDNYEAIEGLNWTTPPMLLPVDPLPPPPTEELPPPQGAPLRRNSWNKQRHPCYFQGHPHCSLPSQVSPFQSNRRKVFREAGLSSKTGEITKVKTVAVAPSKQEILTTAMEAVDESKERVSAPSLQKTKKEGKKEQKKGFCKQIHPSVFATGFIAVVALLMALAFAIEASI